MLIVRLRMSPVEIGNFRKGDLLRSGVRRKSARAHCRLLGVRNPTGHEVEATEFDPVPEPVWIELSDSLKSADYRCRVWPASIARISGELRNATSLRSSLDIGAYLSRSFTSVNNLSSSAIASRNDLMVRPRRYRG